MPQKNTGQSLLEYTAIAMVIMLAIILAGPYLTRSVNAHFRLLDDSVQDSVTEAKFK